MSNSIRPEDLEAGLFFDVAALGTVSLGQATSTDIIAIQKPMREMYLVYHKPTGTQQLSPCRLVVSKRGLALTDVTPDSPAGRVPAAETLFNFPSVVFAAAVKFTIVGKKEKDFKCAFEPIDPDSTPVPDTSGKGKNEMFVALDKKWKHLSKVNPHPAICACAIQQRVTGVKVLELHAFVCESDVQARDFIFALTSASRSFPQVSTSGIYGQGVYDMYPRQDGGMAGMRSDAEHFQQPQQPMRNTGMENVYGHHQEAMGYRGPGPEMGKPVPRPDYNDHGAPWNQAPNGKPPQGVEGPSSAGWLSQQRDQLMKNFNEDQRKNEYMRQTGGQGIYEPQRGAYEPQRGVYEPPKGIYDTQPVYEYRPPPQIHTEPPPLSDGAQRGIYEPPYGARGQGQGQGQGQGYESNLSAPIMRNMSGSSERVFEEPIKSPYEPDTRGFAIPRSRVNYDTPEPSSGKRFESLPSGSDLESSGRPSSLVYDMGHPPASPALARQPQESTLERKTKGKVQPPPPAKSTAVKPKTPSATSPTSETGPGPQSLIPPRGPEPSGGESPEPKRSNRMAMPKKVTGIKVFPTIMLKGSQAAAVAAAAAETDNGMDGTVPEKQVLNQKRSNPDAPGDRRSRDELESAMSNISMDPNRGPRGSPNDFETSLGYFP